MKALTDNDPAVELCVGHRSAPAFACMSERLCPELGEFFGDS